MLYQWILPVKGFPLRGRLEKQFPFFDMWFFDSLKARLTAGFVLPLIRGFGFKKIMLQWCW